MRPQRQTVFSPTEGDCMAACLATLLEVDLVDIPNFCALYPADRWYCEMVEWLRGRGYGVVSFETDRPPSTYFVGLPVDAVYIAGGRSPRHPGKHAVLIDGSGALVFDPHPSDAGILSLDSFDVVFKVMPKTTNQNSGLLEFLGRMRRALGVAP